jgi:uncharacterized damage-inducible protein DinB
MIRLQSVLDSWKTVRKDTAQSVDDMPVGDLEYQPLPDAMSFGEIARHILNAGHGLSGLLLSGIDNFQVPNFRELLQQHGAGLPENADAPALAQALRDSVETRCAELAEQPEEFFSKIITRFDGQQVTRLELLQMIKEHELTHRSQMFVFLRMKGIVPATTRRRQAKK